MAIKLGMEAVLNYKVGGQGGGGAWTALGNTRDVTLNLETGEADVTTRANSGWRATVATLKEASVEFEMVWDTADAGFTRQKAVPFTWGRGGVRDDCVVRYRYPTPRVRRIGDAPTLLELPMLPIQCSEGRGIQFTKGLIRFGTGVCLACLKTSPD